MQANEQHLAEGKSGYSRERGGLSVAVSFLNEDEGQNTGRETDVILQRQLLHLKGKKR